MNIIKAQLGIPPLSIRYYLKYQLNEFIKNRELNSPIRDNNFNPNHLIVKNQLCILIR